VVGRLAAQERRSPARPLRSSVVVGAARPSRGMIPAMLARMRTSIAVLTLVTLLGCPADDAADDEVGESGTGTVGETSETSGSESGTSTGETGTSETSETSSTSETGSGESETSSSESETTGGPDDGQSCALLATCMDLCPDDEPSCEQTCYDMAAMSAIVEYDALVQCVIDNACQDEACIEANCFSEYFACFTGEQTCSEILACSQDCMGDQTCQLDCFYQGTPLAQSQGQALQDCITANQCQDDNCVITQCGGELATCTGGMSDALPCPIVAECSLECGDDLDCIEQCSISASATAQAEAPPLLDCAAMNQCQDFECTEQACPDEWATCVSGEANCADTVACVDACAGAELCEFVCLTEADFMGQVLFGALAQCVADNMCADEACVLDNCGVELQACGV
jgi:hypothetical protein